MAGDSATPRWPRSARAAPSWWCWTSGCRARKLDGIEILETIKREQPDLPVVMISGHGTIETAVASIKQGRL